MKLMLILVGVYVFGVVFLKTAKTVLDKKKPQKCVRACEFCCNEFRAHYDGQQRCSVCDYKNEYIQTHSEKYKQTMDVYNYMLKIYRRVEQREQFNS